MVALRSRHLELLRDVETGREGFEIGQGHRYRVVEPEDTDTHVPRKDARALYEDLTPPPTPEEVEQRRIDRLARAFLRPQSAGSPDKRERRQLRRMKEGD